MLVPVTNCTNLACGCPDGGAIPAETDKRERERRRQAKSVVSECYPRERGAGSATSQVVAMRIESRVGSTLTHLFFLAKCLERSPEPTHRRV